MVRVWWALAGADGGPAVRLGWMHVLGMAAAALLVGCGSGGGQASGLAPESSASAQPAVSASAVPEPSTAAAGRPVPVPVGSPGAVDAGDRAGVDHTAAAL